jgi:uncharacterized damage-inducible protein DinB
VSIGEEKAGRVTEAAERLVGHVRSLDPKSLANQPGEGEWSALQVLGHVAEFIPFWARKARGVAASDHDGIDFSRTVEEWELRRASAEDVGETGAETLLASIQDGAREAAAIFRRIPDERWQRRGRHWLDGLLTVEQLVDRLILRHLDDHVEQARRAAEAAGANTT